MNNSWASCTVQDLIERGEAELKTGPFGTQLHASDYVESGTPVINVRNIGFGEIREEKLEFISEETVQRLSTHLLEPNDIVFGRKGAVERHVFIRKKYAGWFQGSDCLRLRLKCPSIEPRFLSYYFFTEYHKSWMMNQCSHGATMASLNQKIIGSIPLRLPPLPTQRKIAAILSAYDDLIENNTRRIKILEEMASALYREWFVNFRFPGHEKVRMEESELGPKPEGWEVVKVDSILKRLKAGNKYTATNVANVGKIPVVDQSRDEFLGFHNNDPDFMASPKNPIIIFGDHTCKMQMMVEPFSIGPNVVPFIPIADIPTQYLYSSVRNLVETKEYKRHWSELKNKKIVFDPNTDSRKFSAFTIPIFEQINLLTKKNQILRHTRDLLLPSLISGEIDINVLEIGVDMFKS